MTLPLLVLASQIADGLGYVLLMQPRIEQHGDLIVAFYPGVELNPLMAAIGDPVVLLAIKVALGLVLTVGAMALVRAGRRRGVAWLAVVGFVGAWSELAAL